MRVRGFAALAAALLAAAPMLAACDGDAIAPPAETRVDVDTPELRELKAAAGIEDCPEGTTTDGGLPDLTVACLGGGREVDLSTLEGPLVLNFWYAACGPCRKEMPAIQAFYERHGDRVPVLGVDIIDVFPQAALELARDTGATYPQVADPGGELQGTALRPRVFPTFAFLTEDGEVHQVQGGIESSAELVALVEEHLGVSL